MIQKSLIIVYKLVDGKPLFFIGKRPETGIYQPPTGHVEEGETYQDAAIRELGEELGINHFRNFIDLKESFEFTASAGKAREHAVAIEIGEEKIVLEEIEFGSYEFLPLNEAVKIVKFETHKKFLTLASQKIIQRKYPKIFIICGPSGSGKDTIIKALTDTKSLNLVPTKSATTRKKRKNDRSNRIYLSKEEFDAKEKNKELIEKNFFNGNWYGTLRKPIEQSIKDGKGSIMEIDLNGVNSFKKKYSNVVAIFIKSDLEDLKKRMIKRAENSPENIAKRINVAKVEMQNSGICDYIVENPEGELDQTIEIVKEKIKGEL